MFVLAVRLERTYVSNKLATHPPTHATIHNYHTHHTGTGKGSLISWQVQTPVKRGRRATARTLHNTTFQGHNLLPNLLPRHTRASSNATPRILWCGKST